MYCNAKAFSFLIKCLRCLYFENESVVEIVRFNKKNRFIVLVLFVTCEPQKTILTQRSHTRPIFRCLFGIPDSGGAAANN